MTPEEHAYRASRALEAANWAQILGPACWLGGVVVVALIALYVFFCREGGSDGL